MNAASTATASAYAPGLAPAGTHDRDVPAHARQLAARLSALFERDVEIVERLNHAHHRLADANELLWSGLAPDAFGLIYDGAAAAAIGTSQVAALIRDGDPLPTARCLRACRTSTGRSDLAFAPIRRRARSAASSLSTWVSSRAS